MNGFWGYQVCHRLLWGSAVAPTAIWCCFGHGTLGVGQRCRQHSTVEVGKTPAKVDENIMQKFFKKEEAQKLRICLVDSGSSEDRARQKALGLIWVNHHFPYCWIATNWGTMLHFRTHPFPFMHSLIKPSIFYSLNRNSFVQQIGNSRIFWMVRAQFLARPRRARERSATFVNGPEMSFSTWQYEYRIQPF